MVFISIYRDDESLSTDTVSCGCCMITVIIWYITIILLLYYYYITIISLLYHYYITIISLLECHYYSILLSKALYHPICSTAATVAFSARLLPKRLMPKSRKQQMAWKVSSSRSALWRTVEMSWGMAGVVIVFTMVYYGLG